MAQQAQEDDLPEKVAEKHSEAKVDEKLQAQLQVVPSYLRVPSPGQVKGMGYLPCNRILDLTPPAGLVIQKGDSDNQLKLMDWF